MTSPLALTLTALNRAQVSANVEVPAEPCGTLDGMNLKFDDKGAAIGQVVLVPVVVPDVSTQATPSAVPSGGSTTQPVNMQVQITNSPQQAHTFIGEDLRLLETTDSRDEVLKQWLAQAQRTHRNEMSAAAAVALCQGASRAYVSKTANVGSTPFKTDLNGLTQARKILRANGAPMSDVQVVTGVDAYANMLGLNVIQKAQEAGSDEERRKGIIKSQFGFNAIREDTNIADHIAGAATTVTVNNGGNALAIGTTAIPCTIGNAHTTGIQLGDAIQFAGDANIYMVGIQPGTTTAAVTQGPLLASGTFYIGAPGLRTSIADGAAITILSGATLMGNTGYTPSFVYERHCAVGVIRPPIMPMPNVYYNVVDTIKDKFGYTYLFAESNQVFQVTWYLWVCYGFTVTQREYVVPIIGN